LLVNDQIIWSSDKSKVQNFLLFPNFKKKCWPGIDYFKKAGRASIILRINSQIEGDYLEVKGKPLVICLFQRTWVLGTV
jgi:hypothetical protein